MNKLYRLSLVFVLTGITANTLSSVEPLRKLADWSECVQSLDLPTDANMLPFRLRGTTTVNATVVFDGVGKSKIVLVGGAAPAREAVSIILETSRFRGRSCRGRSIELTFTFAMEGIEVDETYLPQTQFAPPNHFTVIFRPRPPIVEHGPLRHL